MKYFINAFSEICTTRHHKNKCILISLVFVWTVIQALCFSGCNMTDRVTTDSGNLTSANTQYVQGDTSVRAVNQVSLDIQPGEFVVIMGISGSEKYVLLHILGDLGEVNGYSDSLIGYDQSKDVI